MFNGITFDSNMECMYYKYLLKLQQQGFVVEIKLQPKKILVDKFEKYGKKYRPITYSPDFFVRYSDGTEEYIDVKGVSTQQGDLRRKIFDSIYPDVLRWVSYSKKYGVNDWIEYDELKKKRKENKGRKTNE